MNTMLLVVVLNNPRASLRGYCRRFLAEPHPNVFVGQTTRLLLDDVVKRIDEAGIKALMIVGSTKSDTGCRMKTFGDVDRFLVDSDGMQLVSKKTSK